MPLIKLLKTSTFRLAVIYLALFAASAITLLAYVYWNTAGFLARQTDEAVEAEIGGLAEQYRQGGLPLLVHTVIQRSRDPGQSLYLVLDPAGRVLAGTLDARPQAEPGPDGWFDFNYNRKTLDGTEVKAARARAFFLQEGFYLLVGRDVQERREIESLITNALIWAIGLTVALGLAGGLFMSRNMLARVDEINRSSLDIMGGDLSQRLPIAGTGDELDQLGQNLNAMLEQIEALMIGMRQVTDNVAHDLRSPLNRLRNRLEVTLMQDASKEDYKLALEKTIAEADNLLGTFNALLMIARAEAGSLRDAMSWVDLSATVQDVAELYEPLADENGLELKVLAEPGLMIWGNRELLSQAVANLLDNAIKHGLPQNADNERMIEISARPDTARSGRGVVLSVADRGPGIPPEERQHVLERFVRLEASRNTPGSGLGLSLVAAVARLHGGTIELGDNEPGLRVSMSLPVSGR
ncbi:MAG: HAMP domain-containing histidine kinase [Alphaproteobacteria bacterium]|nr:HAMP domain-containing histidine kinase [Alphaproteobacteria bacterium]MDX5416316.1 HAMP domain-containing histidine kinase [Alphaproteobacteria bacterium]MDX5493655.1 HAMP domain-containing histidine kinase [Alphaproteobacteria bacterium]